MDLSQFLPIPALEEAGNLLCVMPHPDDNEIGAGGTIAKLAARGAKVTYLGVTDGSAGTVDPAVSRTQLAATRKQEQAAAAAALGVQAVEWLDYPDGDDLPALALRLRIVEAIRRLRPDFVLTVDPWLPYEAHPDHRLTGIAVAEATLLAGFPTIAPEQIAAGLTPHGVTGVAFYASARPNVYVDIDATFERKLQALGHHQSQLPEPARSQLSFYLDLKAQELAARGGLQCKRAEAFKVLTTTHLHMNVDTAEI